MVMRWEDSEYHRDKDLPLGVECIGKDRLVDGHYAADTDFKKCPILNCKRCPLSSPQEICQECENPLNRARLMKVDPSVTPNKCVEACPNMEHCKECDSEKCLACFDRHVLGKVDRVCKTCIGEGEFIDEANECDNCIENCVKCSKKSKCERCSESFYPLISSSGKEENQCVDCKDYGFFKNKQGSCQPCQEGCLVCQDSKSCENCDEKNSDGLLFLQPDKNGCRNDCPQNYFKDKASLTCLRCPDHCINCNDEDGNCLECTPNHNLTSINTCILCKKTGKYIDSLGNCLDCSEDSNCARCDTNPPNECSSCSEGYQLKESKCVLPTPQQPQSAEQKSSCPEGYKEKDKECIILETIAPFKKIFNSQDNQFEISFRVLINKAIENVIPSDFFSIQIAPESEEDSKNTKAKIKSIKITEEKRKSTSALIIQIQKPEKGFYNATAIITLTQPSVINQTHKEYRQMTNSTIIVHPVKILSQVEDSIVKTADIASKAFSVISIIVMLISIKYGMQMNKIYQMFEYLLYLNLTRPPILQLFLSVFNKGNVLSFLPNFVGFLTNDHCYELGKRFVEEGMVCQLLGNIGSVVSILAAVLIIRIFLEIFGVIVKKYASQKKQDAYFQRLEWYLGRKTLFFIISGTHLDIYFSAFVHFRYYKEGSGKANANALFSLLFVTAILSTITCFVFINGMVVEARTSKKEELMTSYKPYMFLAEGVSYENHFGRYFTLYKIIKDPFIAAAVVFAYDVPGIQITLTLLIIGGITSLLTLFSSLEDTFENYTTLFSMASFTGINLLFLLQLLFGISETSVLGNWIIGSACTVLGVVIILSNLAPGLVEVYVKVKKVFLREKRISEIVPAKNQEKINKSKVGEARAEPTQAQFDQLDRWELPGHLNECEEEKKEVPRKRRKSHKNRNNHKKKAQKRRRGERLGGKVKAFPKHTNRVVNMNDESEMHEINFTGNPGMNKQRIPDDSYRRGSQNDPEREFEFPKKINGKKKEERKKRDDLRRNKRRRRKKRAKQIREINQRRSIELNDAQVESLNV